MGLLKNVMRISMTSLKGADAKDIASSVTAIANEKIKAEKEANAGKKKTGNFNLTLEPSMLLLLFMLSFPLFPLISIFAVSVGGKKKQLTVDKPDEDFVAADRYDALDDYDFM